MGCNFLFLTLTPASGTQVNYVYQLTHNSPNVAERVPHKKNNNKVSVITRWKQNYHPFLLNDHPEMLISEHLRFFQSFWVQNSKLKWLHHYIHFALLSQNHVALVILWNSYCRGVYAVICFDYIQFTRRGGDYFFVILIFSIPILLSSVTKWQRTLK